MTEPDISKITIDIVRMPECNEYIKLSVLRLDKIHPVISGNKWFKLKNHIEKFQQGVFKGIVTFGGAWSNHIIATAAACKLKKIACTGIIRGEKPTRLSPTLLQAQESGMHLDFISRDLYKHKNDPDFLQSIKKKYPGFYIIPEGGAGSDGEKGAGEILSFINQDDYSHIACAIGTCTMYRGLKNYLKSSPLILIGIPVLKGFQKEVEKNNTHQIYTDYHFGGYAKTSNDLFLFMNEFYKKTNIPSDIVYTGKLFFAIHDLIIKKQFPDKSKILMIHSGGLQGNSSLPKGTLIF